MQIKVLESFLCLYQERNISRAGAKLYISQQGLSRQIQSLENELGVSLFSRSKSGVVPTEVCKAVYPHVRHMYEDYLKAEQVISYYKRKQNNVFTIAFAYGITNSISSAFMFDYQKKHPDLNLEIVEWSQEVCIEKLLNKELDGAFLVSPVDKKSLNATPLVRGEMYVAMHKSHPLAAETEPLDFKYLDGESIITGVPENAVRQLMDHYCKKTGISTRMLVSSSNNISYINSMTENSGIGPLTQTMTTLVTNPDVVLRKVITPEEGFLYYCTPHDEDKSKFHSLVLRFIENHFIETPLEKLL